MALEGSGPFIPSLQLRSEIEDLIENWSKYETNHVIASPFDLFHGGFIYWTSFQDLKEFEDDEAKQDGMNERVQ